MATFQARYWFDSNSRDKTGEVVNENIEGNTIIEVAATVKKKMEEPIFAIAPSFGPAHPTGVVLIHTAQVRYVEIVPVTPIGIPVE